MKKVSLLVAAVAFVTVAFAQNAPATKEMKKEEKKEVKAEGKAAEKHEVKKEEKHEMKKEEKKVEAPKQ